MADIGKRIHDRRIEIGMSPEILAERIGVSRATLYRYEGKSAVNLPASAIDLIADALNVTPAYLMGWPEDNEFSRKYRDKLAEIIINADSEDIHAAGIDLDRIQKVIDGDITLTLDLACEIADELGISLDDLFGHSSKETVKAVLSIEDSLTAEIIQLLLDLPEEIQREALRYIRYLSNAGEK